MQGYLKKFNQLPENIKKKASSPEVMHAITEVEKKYGINLAALIIRVLVRDISIAGLHGNITYENKIDDAKAREAVEELKKKVFADFRDYLDVASENTEKDGGGPEARFYFSPEDEEEVEKYAGKISGIAGTGSFQEQIEQSVKNVITELNIGFSSEMLKNRLENALRTYIRGIRNRIDTKETFLKPVITGGLGVTEQAAERIMRTADKYKNTAPEQMKKPRNFALEEDKKPPDSGLEGKIPTAGRDMAYDFSKLKADQDKAKAEAEKKEGETQALPAETGKIKVKEAKALPDAMPEKAQTGEERPVEKKEDAGDKEEEKKTVPNYKPINILNVRDMTSRGKIKMQDVKQVKTKLIGPIEELRDMDLVNFRRFGKNPDDIAAKIEEKMDFLEDESYSRRLEGVSAWRKSPVNKLYLEIGRISIEKKQPVEEVIAKMKESGEKYLTIEEFNAIMNLNKKLRY